MLCKQCKEKPLARGIKQIRCLDCYKETIVNSAFEANICDECSDRSGNCVRCGGSNKSEYKVITLCGSTKFKDDFIQAQEELTLNGHIVISVGLFGHADKKYDTILTDDVKDMLDDMHKRKIDMADEIYVINKDGYIGKSTKSEIEYASRIGKRISYMFE